MNWLNWQIWATFGMALIMADAFVINSSVIIWFGIGGVFVAAMVFVYPDTGWMWQLGVFATVSPLSLALWKWYEKKRPRGAPDSPNLNKKGAEYIGNIYTLEGPMENGIGRIKIGDTSWLAKGDERLNLSAGGKVMVEDIQGTTIVVKKTREQT